MCPRNVRVLEFVCGLKTSASSNSSVASKRPRPRTGFFDQMYRHHPWWSPNEFKSNEGRKVCCVKFFGFESTPSFNLSEPSDIYFSAALNRTIRQIWPWRWIFLYMYHAGFFALRLQDNSLLLGISQFRKSVLLNWKEKIVKGKRYFVAWNREIGPQKRFRQRKKYF